MSDQYTEAEFAEQQHTDAEIDECVEEVKAEILDDIGCATGSKFEAMPESIRSFSELHDYVDANEYGGLTDPDRRADWTLGDVIAVQEKVDAWLQAGGHLDVPLQGFTFNVVVQARSRQQAVRVMAERANHDEDYGFEYHISWERTT